MNSCSAELSIHGGGDSDCSISGVESSSDEESETTSSVSSSHQPPDAGPLNDISTLLLRQLPLKRGLSMHYDGKSQSFTSLANVKSVEDLPKPNNPPHKKKKN